MSGVIYLELITGGAGAGVKLVSVDDDGGKAMQTHQSYDRTQTIHAVARASSGAHSNAKASHAGVD